MLIKLVGIYSRGKNLDHRILISTQALDFGGGVFTQVKLLTDFLLDKGLDLTVSYPKNPIKNLFYKEERYSLPNVRKIEIPSFHPFLLSNYALYSYILKKHLDEFNVFHGIGGSSLEASPFFFVGKKYVCWINTTFSSEWKAVFRPFNTYREFLPFVNSHITNLSMPILRHLERKILEKATIIASVSSFTAEQISREFDIKEKDIRIVPNPIDFSKFDAVKSKYELNSRYIIFVGRLDPRKSLETLLKAFSLVLTEFKGLKLIIVGDGSESRRLMFLSQKMGLSSAIEFLGDLQGEQLISYYKGAELFVLSSLQEGFGIVLIEALACGIPVISTDCGGPKDIVEDAKNGFLVPVGDYRKMAEKIIELLQDENMRKEMGRYGKEQVRKKFSIDVIGEKFLNIYRELLD